jgi:hypothetical protein
MRLKIQKMTKVRMMKTWKLIIQMLWSVKKEIFNDGYSEDEDL